MRFFADQDVDADTVRFLRGLGHDVLTAHEASLSDAEDADLLATAQSQGRELVSRDRDYGNLVFVLKKVGGVIYLRILPSTIDSVHAELGRLLHLHSEADLLGSFVVVEVGRLRIRRPAED